MATSSLTEAEVRRLIGRPSNAYDSHRPLLAQAVIATSGPILELGMGEGSTPGLDAVARATGRIVVSYEDDAGWFRKMGPSAPDLPILVSEPPHFYHLVDDWEKAEIGLPHRWGVALVDHGQIDRRVREIGRLAQNTEIVVVHDTEDQRYRYWTIWGLFKYRHDYMKLRPWTTAFSNFLDLSVWDVP